MGKKLIIRGADFSNVAIPVDYSVLTKDLCKFVGYVLSVDNGNLTQTTSVNPNDRVSEYIPIDNLSSVETNGSTGGPTIPAILYFDKNKRYLGYENGQTEILRVWKELKKTKSELNVPEGTVYVIIQLNYNAELLTNAVETYKCTFE